MIKLEGTEQLNRTAGELALAGKVGLRKQMLRNLRPAVEPVKAAVRKEAQATLPRAGGANEWVASAPITISTTATAKTVTVAARMRQPSAAKTKASKNAKAAGKRFRGNTAHNLAAIDAGALRHPLFGNRDVWSTTKVKAGFFTRPCRRAAPAVRAACEVVVEETAIAAGFNE